MKCLVATPHRYGIREVAERVGGEWESMGHAVDYELARGGAARVGPITIGAPGIAVWWYRLLRRLARDGDGYDLVWTHQPTTPVLPTREPSFWERVVVTHHTTACREYELARAGVYPRRQAPYYWLAKTLEGRFHRSLVAVDGAGPRHTVVSPHLERELEAYGVTDPACIPNGAFTASRGAVEPGAIRAEYGIDPEAVLVFNVGSFTPQKRPVVFARLMCEVTERNPEVVCVMAGDGPLRGAVQAQVAGADRVRALGYVSDEEKWRWFAAADVFASLSAYEGMPVATMEALSAGLPVVLSDVPAHRTLLERHGATGGTVADDVDELGRAILEYAGETADVSVPAWSDVARAYLDLV